MYVFLLNKIKGNTHKKNILWLITSTRKVDILNGWCRKIYPSVWCCKLPTFIIKNATCSITAHKYRNINTITAEWEHKERIYHLRMS